MMEEKLTISNANVPLLCYTRGQRPLTMMNASL